MNRSSFLARLREPQPPPPWTLMDVLITLGTLALSLFFLGSTLALLLFPNRVASAGAVSTTSLLFGWNVGWITAVAYTFIVRQRTTAQWQALALQTTGHTPLPLVLLWAVGIILLIDVLAAGGAGAFLPTAALSGIGAGEPVAWILAAALLLIVQPLADSVIFMGVILPRLRASLSPYGGILATAALYAAVHFLVYGATLSGAAAFWYGIFAPLATGLFLACVRVYTASTRATLVAAVGMGLMLFLVALVLVS
jgi:membrane protease YdiL (CAAX protease family)